MNQIHIDNGQLGGAIQVIIQSMFIFNFITFINTSITVYDRFLKHLFPIWMGIPLLLICSFIWWGVYYTILFPSIVQYTNRQAFIHKSPIKNEFDQLNDRIDHIEQLLLNDKRGA